MKKYSKALCSTFYDSLKAIKVNPRTFAEAMYAVPSISSAHSFSHNYADIGPRTTEPIASSTNPLWQYFQNHKEGLGIWKWEHYFEAYHRHFAHLVGRRVNVLEIGVYSGGSLEMWRSYFGEKCHVYGVDIEEACKVYENAHISVFIGDQADRAFWSTFTKAVEPMDVVIDDGGHTFEQQRTTLEEMLPHLRPGGVYVCEDVHGRHNKFSAFASALVDELNCMTGDVSRFQSSIHSIHFYPYLVVIEKHHVPPKALTPVKNGTEWQPSLREKYVRKGLW